MNASLNPASAGKPKSGAGPSISKEELGNDIVNLIKSFFGDESAKMLRSMFAENNPDELIEVARDMMSKLLGLENAEKHLGAIRIKYSSILKRPV